MNKQSKNKEEKNLTREQQLEQENLYLRAELEYLKKLQAVVQAREKRHNRRKSNNY